MERFLRFVGKSALLRFSFIALLLSTFSQCFVPLRRVSVLHRSILYPNNPVSIMAMNERWKKLVPVKIRSQRQSIANVQVMGLFGLGGLEVAVICVGIGIVLGPQTIGNLIRSTGKTASEYKTELSKVPDEFQKGYEEGQIDARSRKAKQMVLPDEKEAKDGSNTY